MLNSQSHAALAEIRNLMLNASAVPLPALCGVKFVSKIGRAYSQHCLDEPLVALTVQGHKLIQLGANEFQAGPGSLLVTCVDMPSTSVLMDAGPDHPYLTICAYLDRNILADILAEIPEKKPNNGEAEAGAWQMEADANFIDAFLRLARLLERREHLRFLAPLITREIHFLLLASPRGGCLHSLYMRGARDSRIIDVIAWLKQNARVSVAMENLAKMANMSVSSFHRHFKMLTGISPLQYHKNLRLYEARRLMLVEDMRVAEAAVTVGYESVTQFNREYRRMFGEPPRRDVSRLKHRLNG